MGIVAIVQASLLHSNPPALATDLCLGVGSGFLQIYGPGGFQSAFSGYKSEVLKSSWPP